MSYRLREHTADVAVEATAPDLSGAFAAVADGLAAAHCEDVPDGGERFALVVESEGLEALLFDYLDELVYQRDVRNVLPTDNDVRIEEVDEGWRAEATARGVPLDAVVAREIKAVTYSQMRLEPDDDGWYAYVVFDV